MLLLNSMFVIRCIIQEKLKLRKLKWKKKKNHNVMPICFVIFIYLYVYIRWYVSEWKCQNNCFNYKILFRSELKLFCICDCKKKSVYRGVNHFWITITLQKDQGMETLELAYPYISIQLLIVTPECDKGW